MQSSLAIFDYREPEESGVNIFHSKIAEDLNRLCAKSKDRMLGLEAGESCQQKFYFLIIGRLWSPI